METPFYSDEALSGLGGGASGTGGGGFGSAGRLFPGGPPTTAAAAGSMLKKDALTLSLSEQVAAALKPAAAPPPAPLRADGAPGAAPPDGLLASPDLGLLKLASPELERLIIQSNGLVTTTPTSTQFLYPKVAASEEQEFAEGFVKALEDLHKQNQLGAGAAAAAAGGPSGAAAASAPPGELAPAAPAPEAPVYANLSSYAGGAGAAGGAATVAFAAEPVPFPPPPPGALGPPPRLAALKDEPQTVPEVPSFGESPPLSPIDMDTQERIKAERKRLRNRIAASKCRKRKLERISRLEEKVKTLKSQNTELASTASLLREQVAQLKQKVLSHVNSGCQLLSQHQVPAY
ncbi:transcription factor JunD [Loxodonta africana]|uniref:transcription factor JunD n=1 Tax=Elephas maximus indicus TaxID=99487 RepID=UPI00211668EE|nr:transcription factor JunD [Elephas maximus indicus]